MNYTQGKWEIVGQEIRVGNKNIASVSMNQDEYIANAGIIAASPDMYEALKEMLYLFDRNLDEYHPNSIGRQTCDKAIAAIAKADGK